MARTKAKNKTKNRPPLEARIEAFEKPTARKQHDQHRPGSQRKGRNGS